MVTVPWNKIWIKILCSLWRLLSSNRKQCERKMRQRMKKNDYIIRLNFCYQSWKHINVLIHYVVLDIIAIRGVFKIFTLKHDCRRQNVLILNWGVWNRTDYLYKNGFDIKLPTKVDMPQKPTNQPTNQPKQKWIMIKNLIFFKKSSIPVNRSISFAVLEKRQSHTDLFPIA